MADITADFLEVWDFAAILVAFFGGVLAGFVLSNLQDSQVTRMRALQRGVIVGVAVGWIGTIYYAGRIGVAVVDADPHFGRTLGAWALWLLFAIASGFGILVDHVWTEWRLRRDKTEPDVTPDEPPDPPIT